jgi:hypothetical protein
MTAEIANLIKRVPGGHLEVEVICDFGDFDRDVEEMLLGTGERDGVADFTFSRMGEQEASRE